MSMEFLKGPSGLGQFHKDADPSKAAMARSLSEDLNTFQQQYGDIPLPTPAMVETGQEGTPSLALTTGSPMREAYVLVGPLGAGKTYTGRLIEQNFDIPVLEYEDIFVEEQKANPDGFRDRAEPKAVRAVFEFLEREGKICFENTMARPYAVQMLEQLEQVADVRTIYIDAPPDVTLERLQNRDQGEHVVWSAEEVADTYQRSASLGLDYDLVLDNSNTSDEDRIRQLRELVEERTWHDDYVEVNFRGQSLKFSSWSGDKLTPYDMEYKPWKTAFKRENEGYLRHHDLKEGDVVVDAGGYEGTFSIYAAKAVGESGRVIVFEPDTGNCQKLQDNVALNGLENVTIVNKALWSKDRKLKFNDKHTAGASFNFNASPNLREIDAVSLDSELARLGVSRVDFIKMDVEGSEVHALRGAERTLATNDVNLAIASYHIVEGEETWSSVEQTLREFGYDAQTEYPQHKTTYGSRKEVGK